MTILIVSWSSFGLTYIIEEFIKAGYIIDFFDYNIEDDSRHTIEYSELLAKKIISNNYEFVFSTNYIASVSMACNACRIKYVSWTYDSPCAALYSTTVSYPYNYVFIFDKAVYHELKEKGVDTVYYLPMAAPVDKFDNIIPTTEDMNKFNTEIAFVGSTYSEDRQTEFYALLDELSDYSTGYLDGVIQAQKQIYGKLILDQLLVPLLPEFNKRIELSVNHIIQPLEWFIARVMVARKITAIERSEILQLLGDKHQVHLHTYFPTPDLKNVINKGNADSLHEAILVFKCAKINLNITLRSIETGIPLRVMEIMGSGGFVISNYQEDIYEHFVPDEDIVIYTDYNDLMRKVDYYLEHEEERKQIAKSGYEKVKKYHTYKHRIDQILETINEIQISD